MKTLLGLALLGVVGCEYSDGIRAGTIVKLSRKGLLCKTWEGEMATDAFRTTTDADGKRSTSNQFAFTVPADRADLREKIAAAQASGARVELSYVQTFPNSPCATDTGYWITEVRP